jgi:hypothetical protein
MKSFAIALGALATVVAAQEISGLPECGRFCATDMLNGQAAGIGCESNDLQCLCQSADFMYGLRDCSAATCGPDDARKIIEYGVQICRDAGVEITAGPTGNPSATATSDGGNDSTDTTEGTDGAGGLVSTILTTVSSDGEAVTTTPVATTTIGSGATTATESGSNTPSETPGSSDTSGTGGLVSTITTDGTTLVTTLSTVTSSGDGSETETESGDGGESTNTEGGSSETTESDGAAMPQRTMAPAGIIAAGLAALLL